MKFSFENLEVYKLSIKWVEVTESILDRNPKISRSLGDQLSRAALSIPLNIAEGNGRWHAGDKRQFFWIARGSVFECVPIVEILKIKSIISSDECELLRGQLEVLGKMLTRLIQAHEDK
ncbi:MAG: four helix bundle protein [Pseudobdellovibrionaceae bacterium]